MNRTILKQIFTVCIFTLLITNVFSQQNIEFKSLDGLKITGDLYKKHSENNPFIILFHQAGWSRGEYKEIAPKLNKLGFNCLAVDQRSGKEINGVKNETYNRAVSQGKKTTFVDAIPDLKATVNYVNKKYPRAKNLIIWGSSYTSALILKLAGDKSFDVDALMSFAPGEYFAWLGKPKDYITSSAKYIDIPVFITSAKNETHKWKGIYDAIKTDKKEYYIPKEEGRHGSSTLWKSTPNNDEYWKAVKKFLKKFN